MRTHLSRRCWSREFDYKLHVRPSDTNVPPTRIRFPNTSTDAVRQCRSFQAHLSHERHRAREEHDPCPDKFRENNQICSWWEEEERCICPSDSRWSDDRFTSTNGVSISIISLFFIEPFPLGSLFYLQLTSSKRSTARHCTEIRSSFPSNPSIFQCLACWWSLLLDNDLSWVSHSDPNLKCVHHHTRNAVLLWEHSQHHSPPIPCPSNYAIHLTCPNLTQSQYRGTRNPLRLWRTMLGVWRSSRFQKNLPLRRQLVCSNYGRVGRSLAEVRFYISVFFIAGAHGLCSSLYVLWRDVPRKVRRVRWKSKTVRLEGPAR